MERFAIVFLAASGCLWNAEVVTQGVSVGVVDSAVDFGDVVGWDIATAIAPDVANVVVTAARVQTCTRLSYDIYDEYAHKRLVTVPLDLGQGDAGRHTAGVFAAVFVVIGVATLAVSAIEVAASHETKTRKSRLLGESRTTCEHAVANAPVELVLPSGAVLTAATDMDGRARFTIPANEPDFGTVITRVSDQTREAVFYRTNAGCEQLRDQTFARITRARALGQRARLLQVIPVACGDARAHAWSVTATAALAAVESRCAPIRGFANEVRTIDPELYGSVFVAEPDIAKCLGSHNVASEDRAACIRDRREQLRRSGARMLADLPSCDAELADDPRSAAGDLPPAIDRRMVASAMADVTDRARACGAASKDAVKVHAVVTGDGRVGSVVVESAPEPRLAACVAAAVHDAAFDETWNGGAFSYTFAL